MTNLQINTNLEERVQNFAQTNAQEVNTYFFTYWDNEGRHETCTSDWSLVCDYTFWAIHNGIRYHITTCS